MRTMSAALRLHVLRDSREVLGFRCDCRVEFRHWHAPGCNLGPEHGCWVNDGRCANLHSTPGGAETLLTKLSCYNLALLHVHCLWASASLIYSPPGRGHTLPSLSPLWSGCENPEFLQKTPRLASAARDSLWRYTWVNNWCMQTRVPTQFLKCSGPQFF